MKTALRTQRLERFASLYEEMKRAEEQFRAEQAALIAEGFQTAEVQLNGQPVALTLTTPIREVLDEDEIKAGLSKGIWYKITRRTIVRSVFNEFRKAGKIPAEVVSKGVHEIPSQPYIKVTFKD